jgi:hypothetical protein
VAVAHLKEFQRKHSPLVNFDGEGGLGLALAWELIVLAILINLQR